MGKDAINFLRLIKRETNPLTIAPLGVKRRLSKTHELIWNLINDASFFKIWNFDFITIPLCLDFFFIGFSGTTSIAEHFIKSPINANLPLPPLYIWKILAFSIPQLSVGLKMVLFCII